ncbi:MAG: hypothetical protein ACR2K2_13710 [Mycobacteriales bacterium]
MSHALHLTLLAAAAGAVGTTALNALTHVDMAARGHPASSTPETTVAEVEWWYRHRTDIEALNNDALTDLLRRADLGRVDGEPVEELPGAGRVGGDGCRRQVARAQRAQPGGVEPVERGGSGIPVGSGGSRSARHAVNPSGGRALCRRRAEVGLAKSAGQGHN